MASKLYLSVESSIQNGSFRSHQFYKGSVTNSFNLCLLFIVFYYWELGYKSILDLRDISFGVDI